MKNPYSIQCPYCGANKNSGCVTQSGYPAAVHKARFKAVGIDRPTVDDFGKAWDHLKDVQAAQRMDRLKQDADKQQAIEEQRCAGFTWSQYPNGSTAYVVGGGVWIKFEDGWSRVKGKFMSTPDDHISHVELPSGELA